MPPRLKDIAKLANTSEATVSLVLNGRHYNRVSEAMRVRIEGIAQELGYRPNRQAQLLASGQTKTIGVIVNTLTNSFFSRYIGLLEDLFSARGYHVFPAETRADPTRAEELFQLVAERMTDAVISLTDRLDESKPRPNADHIVFRQESFGSPPAQDASRVLVDYAPATRSMFDHVSAQGATRYLAIMASQHDPGSSTPSERARFFQETLSKTQGLEDASFAVLSESASFRDWYDLSLHRLRDDQGINAVFIHNAHVAAPVLRAIEDAGRRIGSDVAVTTYDDPEYARWLGPGLSVVREPAEDVANALAEVTLAVVNGSLSPNLPAPLTATFHARTSSRLL